jgi:hypothetical protein
MRRLERKMSWANGLAGVGAAAFSGVIEILLAGGNPFRLLFALAACLHERWTVAAYAAALIFVISALLLVRRALKLIRSISI